MSRIPAKDTKPEITVRSILHKKGFRFRIHNSELPGKPDIVLRKYNTVIFIHGCFWHQHPGCQRATKPKSNKEYWMNKLKRNKNRFIEVKNKLKKMGWTVIVIWECEIKDKAKLLKIIDTTFKKWFINSENYFVVPEVWHTGQ